MAEAGWYRDSADERFARWFDGTIWTEHRVEMAKYNGPPPPPETTSPNAAPAPASSVVPSPPLPPPPPVFTASPPLPPTAPPAARAAAGQGSRRRSLARPSVLIPAGVVVLVILVGALVVATRSSSDSTASSTTTTTEAPETTTTVDIAAVQADYTGGVTIACDAATGERLDVSDADAIDKNTGFLPQWGAVSSAEKYTADVTACVLPRREARRTKECAAAPPVELLNRDPDSYKGQCFTFVLDVIQFDQGTGPCTFRARFDSTQRSYNFQFLGENSFVAYASPCPALNPIGVDDIVRTRAVVTGGLEYDTTIGGKATAVQLTPLGDPQILQNN